MGLTAVAGPVLGGVITHANIAGLSWRAVFLVNLPLGAAVLVSALVLREDRAARRPGLDLTGFAISAVAGAAFVVPTIHGSTGSWPAWTWASFGLGVDASGLLVAHIRRRAAGGRDPIIEPSLFGDRGFPAALSILYFAISTGIVFAAVLYVQEGLGRDVLTSSLTVLPFAAGLAASSMLAGQLLVPRLGAKVMLIGIAVLCGGLAAAVVAAASSARGEGSAWTSVALGVAGLGGGLFTVPFFTAALARVEPHEIGSAAGLLNAVQQLGGTLGVAVLGTLYLSRPTPPGSAFAVACGAALMLALLSAATALAMLRNAPRAESSR